MSSFVGLTLPAEFNYESHLLRFGIKHSVIYELDSSYTRQFCLQWQIESTLLYSVF